MGGSQIELTGVKAVRAQHAATVLEARRRRLDLLKRSTEDVTTMARRKSGPPKDETKSQKWSRLANHRLRLAIKGIDGLSKLATNAAYERTETQVELLFKALQGAIDRCEKAYASGSDGTEIPVL
jgi:hypothetical protein